MKKRIAVLLTAIMVMSMGTTVFAANSPTTGTVTPGQNISGSSSPSTSTTTPGATTGGNSAIATRTDSAIVTTGNAGASVADPSNVLPAGANMQSYAITSGATYDAAASIARAKISGMSDFAVYEFDLFDSNSASIHQLNGYVSVTVPVPSTLSIPTGKTVVVYRVEDDGTLTKCDTTVSNGKITFQTNHFSTYIFAVVDAATVSPKTNENSMAGVLAAVLFIAAGTLVYTSRKKVVC